MNESRSSVWTSHNASIGAITIHYLRGRRHGAPPVMLLHGWPEFSGTWRKNLPALSRDYDVVAPDLRGFGGSSKPAEVCVPEVYADDLISLADELASQPDGRRWAGNFIVVGHDVGAFVAQYMARRRPERIRALFFFNCPYDGIGSRWVQHGQFREIWYQSFHQMEWAPRLVGKSRDTCRIYLSHFLRHWSHDPHTFDEDLENWVTNFMQPGALQGGFNWYRSIAEARHRAIAGRAPDVPVIDTPTYVLWGRHDPVLRCEWTDGLEKFFSDVTIEIAEAAGHFVHYEQPELANERMLAFLRRVHRDEPTPKNTDGANFPLRPTNVSE